MKEDIRRRRQARIRELTAMNDHTSVRKTGVTTPPELNDDISSEARRDLTAVPIDAADSNEMNSIPLIMPERDPELVWRASRGNWESQYGWNEPANPNGKRPFTHTLRIQIIGSVLLFAIVSLLLQFPASWTKQAQQWVTASLQHNMNLGAIAAWYEETFGGSPAFIPIWNQSENKAQAVQAGVHFIRPIEGELLQPYIPSEKGIEFIPQARGSDALVYSAAMGKVLDVVRDAQQGITLTIQHSGGYTSTYGHLTSSKVSVNDWVEAGEWIGEIVNSEPSAIGDASTLYFAIQQNGSYVNPLEVIPLD